MNEKTALFAIRYSRCWFTSDTHFTHAKLLDTMPRPFRSIEEMDEEIIRKWNSRVGEDDHVFHLGDFSWKNPKYVLERLNGSVTLISGNHDNPNHFNKFDRVLSEWTGTIEGQSLHLYHYPLLQWKASHHGAIHLYGHVHGALDWLPLRAVDVGVDSWDFYPISLSEINEYLSLRQTVGESARLQIIDRIKGCTTTS